MLTLPALALVLTAAAPLTAPLERRLHLAAADASSHLVNDWNRFQENYLPLYVGDDDPTTAWTDGVEGNPSGQSLRVHVTELEGTTRVRLRVRNGYQKTKKLFAANARVRAATIKLLPSGKTTKVELTDQWDWQEVVIDQPAGKLESVELRVDSVYEGTKYDDVCISDVQLFVTSTTPDNPAFEKSRFEKIRTWKSERVAAARLFKTAQGKSLPVASQYVVQREEEADAPDAPCSPERVECRIAQQLAGARKDPAMEPYRDAIARAEALVKGSFQAMAPVQVSVEDRRKVPAVDGLCVDSLQSCEEEPCLDRLPLPMTGQIGYLNAQQVRTVSVKDPPTMAEVASMKPRACGRRTPVWFAWALRGAPAADGAPGPVQALFLATCGVVESREGEMRASREQLLVYGAGGQLELIVDAGGVAGYRWRNADHGPVLAGGRRVAGWLPPLTVEEATAVAKR